MLSYDKPTTSRYGSLASYSNPNTTQRRSRAMSKPDRHVFVVYGPAGCGKTTTAKYIADRFDYSYVEGDDLHPAANVAKMSAGVGLTDTDRWDWLISIREEAVSRLEKGASGVVVTCSALKEKYRDVIRIASINEHRVHVHFLFLIADAATLTKRITKRSEETGHFMGASMVASQLADLEMPGIREADVKRIDVSGTMEETGELAVNAVVRTLA